MKHIQEVKADDRLLGRKGLRLKVYENGLDEGEFDYYFNVREGIRGLSGATLREKLMQRVSNQNVRIAK